MGQIRGFIVAGLIGVLTSLAGYPVFSHETGFSIENFFIVALSIIIINVAVGGKNEN